MSLEEALVTLWDRDFNFSFGFDEGLEECIAGMKRSALQMTISGVIPKECWKKVADIIEERREEEWQKKIKSHVDSLRELGLKVKIDGSVANISKLKEGDWFEYWGESHSS